MKTGFVIYKILERSYDSLKTSFRPKRFSGSTTKQNALTTGGCLTSVQ